jgi:LacI family transcriptional regulator
MPTFIDPNRPTLADIATYAGVSTATTDRVLNRRPGVSTATQKRVLSAAVKLGYMDAAEEKKFGAPSFRKLTFLLPKGNNLFMQMLGDSIGFSKDYFTSNAIVPHVAYIDNENPHTFAQSLLSHAKNTDGLVCMAPEHPVVAAAIATLAKKKVHVITVISDIPASQRIAYIGLDNFRTGRTAALLIDRFSASALRKIAVINGSGGYSAHQLRKEGLTSYFAEKDDTINVIDTIDSHDDPTTNYQLTLNLLKKHPDLGAIYNTGGASEGIGQAIKELGYTHKIVFIGHGLTPHTRLMLSDDTMDAVITQSPTATVMNCIKLFSEFSAKKEVSHTTTNIRSEIIFKENLP